jgi:hypothetical protein
MTYKLRPKRKRSPPSSKGIRRALQKEQTEHAKVLTQERAQRVNTLNYARFWCFMPITLATQEAEIRRIKI